MIISMNGDGLAPMANIKLVATPTTVNNVLTYTQSSMNNVVTTPIRALKTNFHNWP